MKRIQAAKAATSLAAWIALGACVLPAPARSGEATGHEHHASSGAAASSPGGAAAATPTKTADGKAVLPGVPPGRLVIGGGLVTTITGEVMDPACFLEAGDKSIGKGHYQCAVDCARSGQTLAIYDRAIDRIYFVAGELPGRNPNEPLLPYIHRKVDVVGTVFHRSQAWGIVIAKVEPHQEKGAKAAAAAKK